MDNSISQTVPPQYKQLQFKYFSSIPNWSATAMLQNQLEYRSELKLIKIGKLIRRVKAAIKIQDDVIYQRVTIRIQGRGVLERDEEIGKNIGTKSQFRVSEGQFIMSKIDARNGAFGIVPKALEGAAITQDFLTYSFNTQLIVPAFFVLLTTTKQFYDLCQRASSGTTNRQRIDEQLFLNFEIPKLSLEEQQTLVDAHNKNILEAEDQEQKAIDCKTSIETTLLEFLSIENRKIKKIKKGINFISFKEIERWGADTNLNSVSPNLILKSTVFQNIPLKHLAQINPSVSFDNYSDISFVPMDSVSDELGEITKKKTGKVENSKGYTKFKENDLIWAKITPCMENGKSAIARNLLNGLGFGSTEFYVIRPNTEKLNVDYLHYLLRLELVRQKAVAFFTGSAGQQRVPKFFIEELTIPLPTSLKIQEKIVSTIKDIQDNINSFKYQAQANRTEALTNFETALFKTKT